MSSSHIASSLPAGAALLGGALCAAPLFVPTATTGVNSKIPRTEHEVGRALPVDVQTAAETNVTALALAGLTGAAVASLAAGRMASGSNYSKKQNKRTILLAEPVSTAAAAAAAATAAKAGAAATAAKAGAATAGAKVAGASVASGATVGGDAGRTYDSKPDQAFDPAQQPGVTAPLGYFDPLGFCKAGDVDGFRNLRAAEIKHGRVAMMAAVGAVAQHYVKLPGFDDVPAGLAAVTQFPGNAGFAVLFVLSGLLETTVWSESSERAPGNFGDPLGLAGADGPDLDTKNRELNNGRMAMFAAVGIVAADLLTGKDGIEQLGLAAFSGAKGRSGIPAGAMTGTSCMLEGRTKSIARSAEPVSAAAAAAAAAAAKGGAAAAGAAGAAKAGAAATGAKVAGASVASGATVGGDAGRTYGSKPDGKFDPADQPGVTAPLGYFDPLNFCKVGDVDGFRNFRAAEIKHGRVAMMAAVGAVAQHYVKFPGFDGVPAGLAAVTQFPGNAGFAVLFVLAGLLETTVWSESSERDPGNFGDPLGLAGAAGPDLDTKDRELNNGRMAMFAALGIVAADLLTGKDGVEQLGL